MKNRLTLLLMLYLAGACHLSALDLGVSYAVMSTPETPYVEVNLEIDPYTISWSKLDSTHFQAAAEILVLVKNGDNIIAYEKYLLTSPQLEYYAPMLDVKRLAVPAGSYTLEVTATDQLSTKNVAQYVRKIDVTRPEKLYLTEIQLLRSFKPDTSSHPFVKNGNYLEPLPFNFYDKGASIMAFYSEIYNANTAVTDGAYNCRIVIERDLGSGSRQMVSVGNQKKRASSMDAILIQSDISMLESGNYFLTLELRNKANDLLTSRSIGFQRSNPYLNITDADLSKDALAKQFVANLGEKELKYSMRALSPIITAGTEPEELKNILRSNDVDAMRFFVFRHFVRVDPNNPEQAWRAYIETANAADSKFHSGFRYGFETDRGRIYMKYGLPDDLVHVEDDPSAPPYEIWVYYNFPKTKQRNVKFLFYNPSLAGEDFVILHSTARGEINNPKWEIVLYKRNAGNEFQGDNDWDATSMQRNNNRNARAYFEDY